VRKSQTNDVLSDEDYAIDGPYCGIGLQTVSKRDQVSPRMLNAAEDIHKDIIINEDLFS
jgi:hypothetical protein